MRPTVEHLAALAWVVWYVTWLLAVVFSARTKVQHRADMRNPGRFFMGWGLLTTFVPTSFWLHRFGSTRLAALFTPVWSEPTTLKWVWLALIFAGFAFCWWARLQLGRLWSGYTTLKEGHRVVDTGPYGLVRHPIYLGILFSALMNAGLCATPFALLGWVSLAIGLTMIARVEERFLRAQLGEADYDAYAARVPMLVPGWRHRRSDG